MSLPIIAADRLRQIIHFEDLIEPVSRAFQDFSLRLAASELIVMFPAPKPELGDVYVKTGNIQGHHSYIVKVSPWFAANKEGGQPQGGFIAVFDAHTGHTSAILNEEHYLSDIRTAAAGALAARVLAPQRVKTAVVVGTGVQAYWQPQALFHERPFEELLVWGRDPAKAQRLVERLRPRLDRVQIRTSDNLEEAVGQASVVMTATPAKEPLIKGEWLHAGQHITAVGADDSTKCELDAECLRRANFIAVDSLEFAKQHGDVHRHIASGAIEPDCVDGEIGEILAARINGRTSQKQITIAKFIGLGVQDLAAAEVVLEKLELCNRSSS